MLTKVAVNVSHVANCTVCSRCIAANMVIEEHSTYVLVYYSIVVVCVAAFDCFSLVCVASPQSHNYVATLLFIQQKVRKFIGTTYCSTLVQYFFLNKIREFFLLIVSF